LGLSEKELIIEAIKDQQEIFGDDLLGSLPVASSKKIVQVVNEPKGENVTVKKANKENTIDFQNSKTLDELYHKIHTCERCELGNTRTNFVFGVGNPNTDAMLIGEAPGAEEDKQGKPFVGRAGKLLNDILKAINFERDDVYIANILKCRPPGNRDPLPGERETCRPYLDKQIELINPKVILCLGRIAGNSLLNKNMTLGKLREEVHELDGRKVLVTYHPAALLRNPHWKRDCWEDVKKFRKIYDELSGK
jgi:uracil-DNA glycosylase